VERPIIIGRDSAGVRTLLVAADGLWRWAFRPGAGEEGYRQLVAASANWLLGASDTAAGVALPLRRVVPAGYPVHFTWRTPGPPHPVAATFTSAAAVRTDTLTFDGAGRAEVRLAAGRYDYRLEGGGRGVVAVDPWSAEYLPGAPVLAAQEGTLGAGISRTALRDRGWIYFLVVLLLAVEWWLRRRAGLR
jgi:hypothetical protein